MKSLGIIAENNLKPYQGLKPEIIVPLQSHNSRKQPKTLSGIETEGKAFTDETSSAPKTT